MKKKKELFFFIYLYIYKNIENTKNPKKNKIYLLPGSSIITILLDSAFHVYFL